MATVQSLSTALKKTSDEVIEILVNAGIGGKQLILRFQAMNAKS
ncbi:hypothetical protein BSPWISOXPB_9006 [uncultured Gammaproteobacteria bacterium]|nr:hypothetical protein BSPWISOXPB_9006 [uncultured Gammaproteobacteria bacterium]